MKTKILFFIIFAFIVSNAFAQKVYVPSAQKYVTMVDYFDDVQKDLSKFSGEYLMIYPGYDSKENSEGDAYLISIEMRISNDGKYVSATQTLQIPEKEAVKTTNLANATVFGSSFSSDEMSGKFVVLKYKKKETTFSTKGILKKHTKDDGYDFYEKTK
jgi:hypothetical protein